MVEKKIGYYEKGVELLLEKYSSLIRDSSPAKVISHAIDWRNALEKEGNALLTLLKTSDSEEPIHTSEGLSQLEGLLMVHQRKIRNLEERAKQQKKQIKLFDESYRLIQRPLQEIIKNGAERLSFKEYVRACNLWDKFLGNLNDIYFAERDGKTYFWKKRWALMKRYLSEIQNLTNGVQKDEPSPEDWGHEQD